MPTPPVSWTINRGPNTTAIGLSGSIGYGKGINISLTGTSSSNVYGIYSYCTSTYSSGAYPSYAIYGYVQQKNSYAVYGYASATTSWAVYAQGKLTTTGTKQFVNPHPEDPSKAIAFVCLEGNESGTYFRGTTRLVGGRAEIPIPEEWRLVSEESGITVQLTPIASLAPLTVVQKSRDRIVVIGGEDCEFDYLVNGIRRGFAEYQAIEEDQRHFRPTYRGVPFGGQYPLELRKILVRNGILNADFTPNEQTAARLGWTLQDPPASERTGRRSVQR